MPRMAIVRLADALGSPAAWSFLRGVVAGNRFANAYLLHGPAGVGKGTAALAFARALLCEGRAGATRGADTLFGAPEPLGPPDDACGACAACRKSGVLQHPDLRLLFPVSGEEKELDETIAGTIQSLREDPLFAFRYEKAASIRLSMTRDLLREMAYKPFEAERRVVVVRDADRMREDQFSALLKSLEEPGASTVWVLTTSRLQRLPATIRSRCQRVRFSAWPEAELERFLGERAGIGGAPARMLAALSGGSLGKALVLRDEDAVAERNQALALLQPALTGDAAGLWRGVQTLTRFGKAGRETLRRTIEFQQLWLRDLLRARYDAPRERLVNRDREPELRAQAARLEPVEIRRRLLVLEEALRALEGNVTPELALFSALARAGGQRLGEGEWPAHAAARAEV
jgi:DNA polymerase-3 subunit delta'